MKMVMREVYCKNIYIFGFAIQSAEKDIVKTEPF